MTTATIDTDVVRALIGNRVHATFGTTRGYFILRALTPTDRLILASEGGMETLVERADVRELEDAQFTCPTCGRVVNRVFTLRDTANSPHVCSECVRTWAATQPVPHELCEEEGCEARAYYSPLARKFRCAQHHAKFKTNTGLFVESRVLETNVAVCKGTDTEDPRHRWHCVKGHRWHCKECGARRFNDPAFGTIAQ